MVVFFLIQFWKKLEIHFTEKLKVQTPVAKQNKIFFIKKYFSNYFLFPKFKILSFLLFSKNNNLRNFFKNVAHSICDLGGTGRFPRNTLLAKITAVGSS